MDRSRRRLGTVLAVIALAVAGTVLAATADARIKRCNGQRVLCDQPFNEIVLAGAHNAMSADSLGWVLPNQSIAIPDQLQLGIRALLIDTYYGVATGAGTVVNADASDPGARTYLCHVLCQLGASRLAPVLRQIRRFLRNRPNNVLLIDNEDYISPPAFAAAMRRSGLLEYAYRGPTDAWRTPRWMIRQRQQVVLLADNDAGDYPWYHRTYQGILQETPYTFPSPDLLIEPASWKASCGPNRGDVTGSMFLMNHWSPPTAPVRPDLDAAAKVNARPVIVGRAEECARVRGRLPSIIAADQVTAGDLRGAVRDLNGIVAGAASP
ncbi:MAG: hypothetical protein EDQ89_04650 [Acidobacteria bacterium]|nr:MAG: hypothetical protein EDQ89_04650 [Acidobacteriota bacterium]